MKYLISGELRWLQNYFVTSRHGGISQDEPACRQAGKASDNDLSRNRITVKIISRQPDEVSAKNSPANAGQ